MKLLIVTALQEYRKQIDHAFEQAGVLAYSSSDIQGFKNSDNPMNAIDNWFGQDGKLSRDSVLSFSFTSDQAAKDALNALRHLNETLDPAFAIRAFIVPVEESV